MPRLGRLRDAHPHLELSLSTRLDDKLAESGVLDCAIRFGNGEWEGFDNRLLMNERHIAVCAPALLARQAGRAAIDLNEFTLLHVLASADQRYLTWQHWLKAAGIENVDTRGGYEFDLLDHAIRAAIDGLGVTIADRNMIARELAEGRLVQVLNVHVDGHQSYWLVTRAGQDELPHVTLFRNWLQQEIWLGERAFESSEAVPLGDVS
jgi:LysR family glycine cleavage system transcriptional activator